MAKSLFDRERYEGPLVGWTLAIGAIIGVSIGTWTGYPGPGAAIGGIIGLFAGALIKALVERMRSSRPSGR